MPRSYPSGSRGRASTLAGSRHTKAKTASDGTYQDRVLKKTKSVKHRVTALTKGRRKKKAPAKEEEDSTTTGGSSDEADEEDADDDDDDEEEPAVVAPSRPQKRRVTGRYQYDRSDDNLSNPDDSDDMFGDDGIPRPARPPPNDDDDDNDDDLYRKVDEISDSDPDDVSQKEMTFLEGELNLQSGMSGVEDDEDPSFYLNQIEGMSAYGFGETSEAEGTIQFQISSQSSDDGNAAVNRHVRFEEAFPESKSAFRLSQSPTMTRALLPSALPPMRLGPTSSLETESQEEADYDSDVTEDCLPAAAVDASDIEDYLDSDMSSPSETQKRVPEGKGPPAGTFIDEGDKPAGILDSTGKMLIITNPHHLGEEFARRYGASAPPSPSLGFAEAVFGEDDSPSTQEVNAAAPDPMISSLNGNVNVASNGQAMGPPEAWYADPSFARNFLLDEGDTDIEGLDPGERVMRLEDVIAFDTDSDADDSPTSPAYMSSDVHATPRNNLSHLNTANLMAFRRGTDPAYAALQSSPPAAQSGFYATPKPSRSSKKRKARNESPYSTPLYKGVTPVQRTARSSWTTANTEGSPAASKRRRTMV